MVYRYTADGESYEAYASGGVLYALPGHPPFPVRLASEILQRALAYRAAQGLSGPATLCDPCCGGAYHLAALGLMHPELLRAIYASDIDPDALALAGRNLSLLTPEGLDRRIADLARMAADFGKDSHRAALGYAREFRGQLGDRGIESRVFHADATDPAALRTGLGAARPDLVITDIPYGQKSQWVLGEAVRSTPTGAMLEALRGVLAPGALVAIAAPKGETIEHTAYQRLTRLKLGHRQVIFLQLH